MDPHEIKLVRQYAINEIAGGVILANYALKSDNAYVRSKLTFHAMDELKHGWMWTEFLDKEGVGVAGAVGKNDYFDFAVSQEDEITFLAAIHVYELRIPFHFECHIEVPQMNAELRELTTKIKDEEKFHLKWIRVYLEEKMKTEPQRVLGAVKLCEVKEKETYEKYMEQLKQHGGYLADFATIVQSRLSTFPVPSESFALLMK